MDLESALETYFKNLTAEMAFSGQREGDMRGLIEGILTDSGSMITPGTPTLKECGGFYPVALIEYAVPFDRDQESQNLAMEILTKEQGAHLFQIYFLSETGRSTLVQRVLMRNRQRVATRFHIQGKTGFVSSCRAGEYLYSLIISKMPIPRNIAAA